ncbi:MAG: hypothetical protein HKN48_04395 [Flavobacteriaceae bacterium]|nr:hypothetical protein [Flavobacteriaceae bacterium]
MEHLNDFINNLPDFLGIFILMLSTFLIGYFSAYGMQRAKYQKLLRKLNRKTNLSDISKKEKDLEVIFTEIKPKIIEVVKETQEEMQKDIEEEQVPVKSQEEIIQQARTSYITYTKNKPQLNFDNFGYADASQKEDLTRINGIGPYIEQKLNEIGIYTVDQISKLKEEDIRVITELIDFFPGRIERDDWVGQAEDLTV